MKTCKSHHEFLVAEEFNPLGAVVSCLVCGDTFQIREATLQTRYLHAHHASPEGPGEDMDFFIHETSVER